MVYLVRRAYLVDPTVPATREIEWLMERTLTGLPDVDGATVFVELADDALRGIVVEIAIEASDGATASNQGRSAIRSALRRVGVSAWNLRLVEGRTSEATPPSTDG